MKRLAATELNLLDVGLAQDIQLLLLHRLAVSLGHELALDLVLDVALVFAEDHFAGRLSRAKSRQAGLLPEVVRDGIKSFIHLRGLDFDAHELLARG